MALNLHRNRVIGPEFIFTRYLLILLFSSVMLNGILCTVALESKVKPVENNLLQTSNTPLLRPSSCITADDLTVIQAKRHYEQMIPKSPLVFEALNDEVIMQQIEFFNQLENSTIKAFNDSKTRELMLIAFADAYGAYMYSYIVPVIKYSYYGGFASLSATSEALRLLTKYQKLLETNGSRATGNNYWQLYDLDPSHFFNQVKPISDEQLQRGEYNCHHLSQVAPGALNPSVEIDEDTQELLLISVQYYLNGTVYNPKSKRASRLLLNYYIEIVGCFADKKETLAKFQQELVKWISSHTRYILTNEAVLYPAFEGVLQIQKSVENGRKLPKKSITAINQHFPDNAEEEDSSELFENGKTLENQPEMSTVQRISIWIGCSLAVLLVVYIVFKMQQNRKLITNNRFTQRRRKSSERRRSSNKRRMSRDISEEDEMTVFDRFETDTKHEGRDSNTTRARHKFSIAQFIQRIQPRKWKSTAKGYKSIPSESRDVEADDQFLSQQQLSKRMYDQPQPGPSGINKKQRTRSCSCVPCSERDQDSDELGKSIGTV